MTVGIVNSDTVVDHSAQVIFDADLWVFAVLSSKMHNIWTKAVSGRLESRLRYSSKIAYNTFPLKTLLENEKVDLKNKARKILFTRENHSEKTLAEMYDPDKMPDDLREAHFELDIAMDRMYRQKPYNNDEERLADLFALYEQMTNEEKQK